MPKIGFVGVLRVGDLEVVDARDVTLDTSADMVEKSRRVSAGWTEWMSGWKTWSVNVDIVRRNNSQVLNNIRTAYIDGTEMSLVMVDDDGEGITGTVIVEQFPEAQPLKDVMAHAIVFRGTGAFTVVDAVS